MNDIEALRALDALIVRSVIEGDVWVWEYVAALQTWQATQAPIAVWKEKPWVSR